MKRRSRQVASLSKPNEMDLTAVGLRARSGDATAVEVLIRRSRNDVWRYCTHLVGVNHADDATQATYVRALRSLHNYRGESSIKSWLIGVARHVCLDEYRAQARRSRVTEAMTRQPHRLCTFPLATAIEIEEHVTALPIDRRDAFLLTQVLGFTYEEAAELIGCPVGTVRSRVARARQTLVASLELDADIAAGDRRVK